MSTLSSVPEEKMQMYPFKFESFDDIEKELVGMLKQHALADPSIFLNRTDARFNIIATSIIERIRAAEYRETKALSELASIVEEENVLRQAVDMSGNEFAMGYNDSGCFWSFYAGQRGAGAMIGDPVFTSESPDPIEALKEYIAKQRDQLSNRSSDEKRRTTKPNEEQPNE